MRENKIKDAINSSPNRHIVAISPELLRDNTISLKAQAVICKLMINKDGWKSHFTTLLKMQTDGESALRSALKELEEHNYLIRFRYRNKHTKSIAGTLWSYTDVPGSFDMNAIRETIEYNGYSVDEKEFSKVSKATREKATSGKSTRSLPSAKEEQRINKEQKKRKDSNESFLSQKSKFIEPNKFEEFWKLYHKGTKSKALQAWLKICELPIKSSKVSRPKWKEIKKSVNSQFQSERWSKQPEYIPHTSSWINGYMWLNDADDLKEIKDFNATKRNNSVGYQGGYKVTKESIKM
jgi:hypothetical protein